MPLLESTSSKQAESLTCVGALACVYQSDLKKKKNIITQKESEAFNIKDVCK